MASSVARMPFDEWRHRHTSRLHLHTHKPLQKVLTRISTSIDPGAAAASATSAATNSEPCSPLTASKRRRSQILDRWAARQAREMITTIDRQAHEAELSALSSTTQPVSARAASFLRDTSPDGGGGGAVASDIPPNVRASSLIQMWRELEADAGICPTPRAVPPPAAVEEASAESDTCEEAESCVDWENAVSAENEMTERKKVGDIVRMLSLKISFSAASSSDESDSMVAAPAATQVKAPSFGRSPSMPASLPSLTPTLSPGEKAIRVRGRREMEDLLFRMEKDRQREVAALAERHPVSGFPFRGRIQSMIRLRSLRREVATIRNQQGSQKLDTEICQSGPNNHFSRERSEDRSQHDNNDVSTEETMVDMQVDSSDSQIPGMAIPTDYNPTTNSEGSPSQSFYSLQAYFTPLSRHEETQECSSPDASWDERSFCGGSIDWQKPSESPAATTGTGTVLRTGICDHSQNMKFAGEIQELLEMKAVSTSLASNFSVKMNRVISSFLQRQAQMYADEESEQQGMWRLNYESGSDSAATSSSHLSAELFQNLGSWQSVSLPLSSEMAQCQKRWQAQISSSVIREGEDSRGMDDSIGRIHYEISELKKLVESCLEGQKKLEQSIKQEVFAAVNRLAGSGSFCYNSSCIQEKKENFSCVCCDELLDSGLNRCEHKYACYKCAQELQWSSGKCPFGRSRKSKSFGRTKTFKY